MADKVIETLPTKAGKFTFKVPDSHPEAGKQVEKSFDYPYCETDEQAHAVIAEKNWSIRDMVNDALKSNARSNAYQTALLPYRPSEVAQEDIVERMVRDYIRLGVPEDLARQQVAAILAATK